jgi:hypothetical protein
LDLIVSPSLPALLRACWFGRRLLKASALALPGILIVLDVGHPLENKDFLAGIEDTRDQPILVSPDVEDDAVANDAGRAEFRPDVAPSLP